MVEKTNWLFERSKINPRLTDIPMEVELTPKELQLVLQIHQLEQSEEIVSGATSGSGYVRDYKTSQLRVPFGGSLSEPRDILIGRIRTSRDSIRQHKADIARHTPFCYEQMLSIEKKLSQILGEEEPTPSEVRKA